MVTAESGNLEGLRYDRGKRMSLERKRGRAWSQWSQCLGLEDVYGRRGIGQSGESKVRPGKLLSLGLIDVHHRRGFRQSGVSKAGVFNPRPAGRLRPALS